MTDPCQLQAACDGNPSAGLLRHGAFFTACCLPCRRAVIGSAEPGADLEFRKHRWPTAYPVPDAIDETLRTASDQA